MNIRLSLHCSGAIILSALVLSCALSLSGCGTTRKETEAYQKSVTMVDENGAIRTLRLIATAQTSYAATNSGEYGMFEDLTKSGFLDQRFNSHSPEQSGYVFTMKLAPASSSEGPMFGCYADPKTPTSGIQTNGRHFFLETSGTIHVNNSQQASASDPVLQ